MGGAAIPEVEAAARMVKDGDVKGLLKKLGAIHEGSAHLSELATLDQSAMSRISVFTDCAQKALSNSKQKIDSWLKSSQGASGKEVLQLGDKMEQVLTEIASDLQYLAGGVASASQRS